MSFYLLTTTLVTESKTLLTPDGKMAFIKEVDFYQIRK
jgi:hypothetical protein